MKKILLLTAMLVASVCAMAQSLTVYYVNDQGWDTVNAYAWSPEPNANWPGSPATLTSETCKGATVYSFDVDYSKTTKIISVLDRTKECGATYEPLAQDVISALSDAGITGIKVIGGRYGLSSKEFTHDHVIAIYENAEKDVPKNHFTVGIVDDVTFTSLDKNTKEYDFSGFNKTKTSYSVTVPKNVDS